MRFGKIQDPRSKIQGRSKHQAPNGTRRAGATWPIWDLELGICLEFGVWNLGFGSSLDLGPWILDLFHIIFSKLWHRDSQSFAQPRSSRPVLPDPELDHASARRRR